MALTRKYLKALGIEEDKIDEIISAHGETVEALKKERDEANNKLAESESVAKERDTLKEQVEKLTASGSDAAKVQAEFDAFKQSVEAERTNASKLSAVRSALKAAGVQRDEFVDLLEGKVNLDDINLIDGKIENADSFVGILKTNYAGCFASSEASGTPVVNPPSGNPAPVDPFIAGFDK